ncbi:hypothetical protein NB537_22275 [Vibrio parahaemolyticus]|nr:hypothetical protein [Vibrio parahaemolyticus]MCR9657493.1 hypothetical protein [Vibrio parahaemolyticus]
MKLAIGSYTRCIRMLLFFWGWGVEYQSIFSWRKPRVVVLIGSTEVQVHDR